MADLIDRVTLAEEIESLTATVAGKPAKWYDAKHSVLRIIAEQPTIDPESLRPKGEWIKLSPSKIICANCKNEPTYANLEGYILTKSCPNCGADMRGEDNA